MKKLAVFGSRTLRDYRVKMLILEEMDKGFDVIVTSQEPAGVCAVAQEVAKTCCYTLELHFLDWNYRTGAFEHRSKDIINSADFVLLIHDGKSQGTSNELVLTKKLGKPYRYEKLEIDVLAQNCEWSNPHFESVGKGNSKNRIKIKSHLNEKNHAENVDITFTELE